MTKNEIKRCLQEITYYGYVSPSPHCWSQMLSRNVDMTDIENVMLYGTIDSLQFDAQFKNWKCKISGLDIDGQDLIFVAGVYDSCVELIGITVF